MSRGPGPGRRLQRLALPVLGVAAVLLPLIPLAPGGSGTAPDLLYCLVVAWSVRRPGDLPIGLVVLLGLFADLMLSRPVGLGALGLLLAADVARRQAPRFAGAPFLLEWLAAMAGFALMLAGIDLALRLAFADAPGPSALLRHAGATAIAYPLVAGGLVWGLGLGAPRPGRPTWPGRLS